jgi:type IV secretion/conjugal transfer VirB4 family ATPase
MMSFSEYRRRGAQLADYLPWAGLVGPGVVLNKDGSFQRTLRFRGYDLDSAPPAELASVAAHLNAVLRRLESGWAVFAEARREPAQAYPDAAFPDPVSQLVDEERRAAFRAAGAHFESRYFLTFLWRPPSERSARGAGWLFEGRTGSGVDWRSALRNFIDRTDRIFGLLELCTAEAAWLSDAETLTYLHATVACRPQAVRAPEAVMHLDAFLAQDPLVGGLEPRLGAAHLRVLSVVGFPTETWPGLLDDLNRLAFPYRWSTRALCLDKLEATKLVGRIRRQWFAKRKGVGAILREVLTSEPSALVDTDAENKARDADAALQDLGAGVVSYAFVTAAVVVLGDTAAEADARIRQAEKAIQSRDFLCRIEGANAVEAWLGSLPGHVYANVRQPPISTLNLAHILPLSAVWAGPERNVHLGGPALLQARTAGSTPFRLSTHVGDVGHALVVGPTGAGKSVLLALMAMQFRRYVRAQIFVFDFGGSFRAACLGMGGQHHDLGAAAGEAGAVTLQPLSNVDDVAERSWAAEWLAGIVRREGVEVTPEVRDHIWSALESLVSALPRERTLTGLAALLQSPSLKSALAPYTLAGPYGRLLDAERERLPGVGLQAFETEGLMGSPAAPAVLDYLFHRLEARLDGRPTLIIVDEGWLALSDVTFAPQLREWLKTLRKKNASVIFATQSLADLESSPLAPALVEGCPTRILLPNPRAREPQIASLYGRFGLTERQLEILSLAVPKRDYYLQSPRGSRLFELGLGEIALAFCGASSRADQALIAEVLAAAGPDRFPAEWLRRRGLGWAAELVDTLMAVQATAPLTEVEA